MTETPNTPAGEPPAWQPGPAPTAAFAEQAPAAPAAPATKRPPRLLTVWQTVAVGVACLIVGLGIGGAFGTLVGYVVGHHDHPTQGHPGMRFNDHGGQGYGGGQMGRPGMGQRGQDSQGGQSAPSEAPTQ